MNIKTPNLDQFYEKASRALQAAAKDLGTVTISMTYASDPLDHFRAAEAAHNTAHAVMYAIYRMKQETDRIQRQIEALEAQAAGAMEMLDNLDPENPPSCEFIQRVDAEDRATA